VAQTLARVSFSHLSKIARSDSGAEAVDTEPLAKLLLVD
jgi:hypothetical protein